VPGRTLIRGQSITDACIDLATTEPLLERLALAHRQAPRSARQLAAVV
jgi:phospho-2-dehydro-3-deoxyheptonate aldolase